MTAEATECPAGPGGGGLGTPGLEGTAQAVSKNGMWHTANAQEPKLPTKDVGILLKRQAIVRWGYFTKIPLEHIHRLESQGLPEVRELNSWGNDCN